MLNGLTPLSETGLDLRHLIRRLRRIRCYSRRAPIRRAAFNPIILQKRAGREVFFQDDQSVRRLAAAISVAWVDQFSADVTGDYGSPVGAHLSNSGQLCQAIR